MKTRRQFLKQTSLTAATGLCTLTAITRAAEEAQEFCFFSKHFQGIEFNKLADITAEVGASGIEAPVRPGGACGTCACGGGITKVS
jgi:hypothetical protein